MTAENRFIQKTMSLPVIGLPLDQIQCLRVTVATVLLSEKPGTWATLRAGFRTGSEPIPNQYMVGYMMLEKTESLEILKYSPPASARM